MCQAFEAESRVIDSMDAYLRKKGYDAQKGGLPRESNPERDHSNPYYSDKRQWWIGWDLAAEGKALW